MLNKDIYNLIFKEVYENETNIYQSKLLFINAEISYYYKKYLCEIDTIFVKNGSLKGIKYLKNLKNLRIEGMIENGINEIRSLSKLSLLQINNSPITDKQFRKIDRYLFDIEVLNLEGCKNINNDCVHHMFKYMPNIRELNIRDTYITETMFRNLFNLSHLETLIANNLTTKCIKRLSNLRNLKNLSVEFGDYRYRYSGAGDKDLAYFTQFKSLQKLTYIHYNYLPLPSNYISSIETLEYLDLCRYRINRCHIEDLIGNVPNLAFYNCSIDIDGLKYILDNVDKLKSLKIVDYSYKYTDQYLSVIHDIRKKMENCYIELY